MIASKMHTLIKHLDDQVTSMQKCLHCKAPAANFACGGPCQNDMIRYCSQQCANNHWSVHDCQRIAGKRKGEFGEQERAYTPKIYPSPIPQMTALFQILGQNEEAMKIFLDSVTPMDVYQYQLVSKDFRKYVGNSQRFWFLFLKKFVPLRLLIIHATAAHSNKVNIDEMRGDVDYVQYGKYAFEEGADRQLPGGLFGVGGDMIDLDIGTYVAEIDGYYGELVIPKTVTYSGITRAADKNVPKRLRLKDNLDKISEYFVAWQDDNQEPHGYTSDLESFDFSGLKLYKVDWMSRELTARCSFYEIESSSQSGSESDSE